jgi:hypothetical protein
MEVIMRSLVRQACGLEPEPVWMSLLGAVAVFAIPAAFALIAVAFGWGQ